MKTKCRTLASDQSEVSLLKANIGSGATLRTTCVSYSFFLRTNKQLYLSTLNPILFSLSFPFPSLTFCFPLPFFFSLFSLLFVYFLIIWQVLFDGIPALIQISHSNDTKYQKHAKHVATKKCAVMAVCCVDIFFDEY